jgi:hypothetical protein
MYNAAIPIKRLLIPVLKRYQHRKRQKQRHKKRERGIPEKVFLRDRQVEGSNTLVVTRSERCIWNAVRTAKRREKREG